ncbi:MAG: NAD(P)-dependent alcohol dehydrogenase [Thermoleophilia bacterium]|nr:NAD(P)-dependent alcohol dehydrogenase [Thermoleophilia bacterium]
MRAIVQTGRGSPDSVEVREVDLPDIAPNQALVRVHASSVNPAEWYRVMAPAFTRMVGKVIARGQPEPAGIGADLAGRIEAVGTEVTEFQPGDEVFGMSGASWAEYAPARQVRLVRKPANVSFEAAAAVPVAGLTALQALRDHGRVRAGQKILINGASGGVGTFAVQLAKWLEADVTAVCSASKVELVGSLGADRVVDYTREDFTRLGIRHDVMIDVAGSRPFRQFARVLAPNATVVLTGGSMNTGLGPLPHFAGARLSGLFRKQTVASFLAKIEQADLALMAELLESGRVKPVVERTYPLAEVPAALRHLGEGHARGKLVITM